MTREVTFKPCSLISLPAIINHRSPETSLWQIRLGKSEKESLHWRQCQLDFALWCATAGCGVSFEDHLQAEKYPRLASLYRFHVYYTTRRLLGFTIALDSEVANRTVVQNLGRAIMKKLTIKISGSLVMSIDDSDVFHCSNDLWQTAPESAMVLIRGSMPLLTETRQRLESVPEM